ncbi:MAG: DinB family protein [Eubacteriales bacterium]|nr:DinB family protein [Eubacteriales bacterium]
MSDCIVNSIKTSTDLMFHNLKIAMKTCDWKAEICEAPMWRYIYHTLHSCDKYFINPHVYTEPPFHHNGMDWPDSPCETVLDEHQLWEYYEFVREKTLAYISSLDDEQICAVPDGCCSSRFELILSQFRHMYVHIGILNGVTIEITGQYPRVLNESCFKKGELTDSLFDDDVR